MVVQTPVYLDHHASTPLDPQVLEVLQRVQRDHFGNPASSSHSFGWAAQTLVKNARLQVAQLVGALESEIVFTSGATESNNMVIMGLANANRIPGNIISTCLEHSSVSEPVQHLLNLGWKVQLLSGGKTGIIDINELKYCLHKILPSTPVLVSVIAAQNEIGTVQPLAEIGSLCQGGNCLFHSDAAQAGGHLEIDFNKTGLDLLSLSSHKIYGPKGIGALVIKRSVRKSAIEPLFHGGGQEDGWRSGTLNVPGIAAFGEACRLAQVNRDEETVRLKILKNRFWRNLKENLTGIYLNGAEEPRLPGNLNLRFDGISASRLLRRVAVLALSTGSACGSQDLGPSTVLMSLGLSPQQASSSVRIGLGRFTTSDEVDFAAERIVAAVGKLRQEK